jgi:RNA polymerase sigma-70 factor (ECF subfamily)
MSSPAEHETDTLLKQAATGDQSAVANLFRLHRQRLRQMVAVRMDPRLNSRVDPSDVVQDVLMEASRVFEDFLRERPLPFYPWLRQLAWQRLYDLHVQHVRTQKRTTCREATAGVELSNESVLELARQVVASGTSPSMNVVRNELRYRVQEALSQISDLDREVLVMRYLEQLSSREIAAIIGISESAVNMRHLRALRRLRGRLQDALGEL